MTEPLAQDGADAGYRIGIDIGGTFTDGILVDERSGSFRIAKVLTTPHDPSVGFMTALERLLDEGDVIPSSIRYVVHATTVATNAIIEGNIAQTAFITTHGFRDMLEIARQIRPSLFDVNFEKPAPLVPRYHCFGVRERVDAAGQVLHLLDEDAVREIAAGLRDEGVEAVAICFLHSYANASHEARAAAIVREVAPDLFVSTSADVAPEFREYARASTTVINAALRPVVDQYLRNIEHRVAAQGIGSKILVMQSSGGVYTADAARSRPVFMVESGPAAGVIAAGNIGTDAGFDDLISFDMGGTTAKVGLIEGGVPQITKDFELGATAGAGLGDRRGAGYPIRAPVLDLVEIGAGGGSIAWVDSGAMLRVGPRSAGADPGPACYGRGGTEPTVTDANLVLGRLDAHSFLGGELVLDVDAATRAIHDKCAVPLGMDVVRAAHSIVEIANIAMSNALRLVTVQRGHDPRDFALVAFGGAGPVHANRIAAANQVRTTIIPVSPGIASAAGLLGTDLKQEYAQTVMARTDAIDVAAVDAMYAALERQSAGYLEAQGVPDAARGSARQAELRYVGQSYELTLDSAGEFTRGELDRLVATFHDEHERVFGFNAPEERVELVNIRVIGIGAITRPDMSSRGRRGDRPAQAEKGQRPVVFDPDEGPVMCKRFDRYRLGPGTVINGPAIIEEVDSTTVLHAGYRATVNRFGHIVMEPETGGTGADAQ